MQTVLITEPQQDNTTTPKQHQDRATERAKARQSAGNQHMIQMLHELNC